MGFVHPRVSVREGDRRLEINIAGRGVEELLARRNASASTEIIESLQFLLQKALFGADHRNGPTVVIDVLNFRQQRMEELRAAAERVAAFVRSTGKVVRLGAMNSIDRRAFHQVVSEDRELRTESIGYGPLRRLEISKNAPRREREDRRPREDREDAPSSEAAVEVAEVEAAAVESAAVEAAAVEAVDSASSEQEEAPVAADVAGEESGGRRRRRGRGRDRDRAASESAGEAPAPSDDAPASPVDAPAAVEAPADAPAAVAEDGESSEAPKRSGRSRGGRGRGRSSSNESAPSSEGEGAVEQLDAPSDEGSAPSSPGGEDASSDAGAQGDRPSGGRRRRRRRSGGGGAEGSSDGGAEG